MGAGHGSFQQVRTLAGQGHARFLRVTLPRYATLESVWPIESPWMGLLRRPTTGEIMEDGRLGRPCGPGALRAQLEKTNLRLRRHSMFRTPVLLPHAAT